MLHETEATGFERHVHACNNAELPGRRIPFLIRSEQVGWVSEAIAAALWDMPAMRRTRDCATLTDGSALLDIASELSERGLCRLRGEAFDVRARADGPVLGRIDRGAIPTFGIQACGVHVNGLVRCADGLHVWVARRSADRLLDPGKLDHIVAGGIPAGLGPRETLVKEAGEEAAMSPELASQAVQVGVIEYRMDRPEGLRRDRLYCYDLLLPPDFVPKVVDGEVEAFELWPLGRAAEAVRDTDDFKFNVNLVLIDLFIRQGLIGGADAGRLRTGLRQG